MRSRVIEPRPHSTSHLDHCPHSETTQSTAVGANEMTQNILAHVLSTKLSHRATQMLLCSFSHIYSSPLCVYTSTVTLVKSSSQMILVNTLLSTLATQAQLLSSVKQICSLSPRHKENEMFALSALLCELKSLFHYILVK